MGDELDPGEWGSSDRALVWCQVELKGLLCRSVFVETKDVPQECQTHFLYSLSDMYFFGDAVEFFTTDGFRVLLMFRAILRSLLWKLLRDFSMVWVNVQVSDLYSKVVST